MAEISGTYVYTSDGDDGPFHIREDMEEFTSWFQSAKNNSIASIEVHTHHTGSHLELVTDHIVAFAPVANPEV